MLGLAHFLGLDIRLSATVLFFQSQGPNTVNLIIIFHCSLVPLALFPVFLFVRRCREKQFYPILSCFKVLCTSLLICKMGIATECDLWDYRNDAWPGTSSVFSHCSLLLFHLLSSHFLMPSFPCHLVPNFFYITITATLCLVNADTTLHVPTYLNSKRRRIKCKYLRTF